MAEGKFSLHAIVRSRNPDAVERTLGTLFGSGCLSRSGEREDEITVESSMSGESSKELNRSLLSALRKVEKRTTLRAEWTSGDVTDRYFDYVLKKTWRR